MGFKEEMSIFGSYLTALLAAAIFFLTGNMKQFYQIIIAFALLYAIVFPIRTIWFKSRPKSEPHHDLISKFTANTLVSIHSARAFMLAAILSAFFEYKIAFLVLFSIAVLMVCSSRLLIGKHRPIDIATGLLVGAGIALLVLNFI